MGIKATYAQPGEKLDYTPAVPVSAGDVVVQGNFVGVSALDIPANTLGALKFDGAFDVLKDASVFAFGDWVFWSVSGQQATSTADGNVFLGKCAAAALTGDATVKVRLCPDQKRASQLNFAIVAASTAVANTTVETPFDQSVTIPANTLKVGDTIRVRAQVIAPLTNSTDTLLVKLKIGNTVLLATTAVDVANNDIAFLDMDVVVRTIGATGTIVAAGSYNIGTPGAATPKAGNLGSTAIDTTAPQALTVTATWSVANAGDSCRLDMLNAEILSR
jgi:predicted RecA/RadA family phage recombinase